MNHCFIVALVVMLAGTSLSAGLETATNTNRKFVTDSSGIRPLPSTVPIGDLQSSTFTMSGISSGACMTVQFQYAWSSIVKGVAVVAAAPYLCAGGTLLGAEACLNTPWIEAPEVFHAGAVTSEMYGWIDPMENIANHTIFLFSGTKDTVVPQPNMQNVNWMYNVLGAGEKVHSFFDTPAEHAWITSKYGDACSYLGRPYVNNCNLDFGGRFFKQAFGDLGWKWNNTPASTAVLDNLFSFDQTQFGADPLVNSMAMEGFVYIPTYCQTNGGCHLHVNLHGCSQSFLTIGTAYMLQTQLNEWAESNNIVVVYPQAVANDLLVNPLGCFDWWGYAGETYALKSGPQISIIRGIIEYLGGF